MLLKWYVKELTPISCALRTACGQYTISILEMARTCRVEVLFHIDTMSPPLDVSLYTLEWPGTMSSRPVEGFFLELLNSNEQLFMTLQDGFLFIVRGMQTFVPICACDDLRIFNLADASKEGIFYQGLSLSTCGTAQDVLATIRQYAETVAVQSDRFVEMGGEVMSTGSGRLTCSFPLPSFEARK